MNIEPYENIELSNSAGHPLVDIPLFTTIQKGFLEGKENYFNTKGIASDRLVGKLSTVLGTSRDLFDTGFILTEMQFAII